MTALALGTCARVAMAVGRAAARGRRCSEDEGYEESEIDGVCPDCGEPTIDGQAVNRCFYSPVVCETCRCAPCDGSC